MEDYLQLKRNLKKNSSSLPLMKVSLLGDSATQFLATAIKGMGVERGYSLGLYEAEYNQVVRQVMDPTSDLHTYNAKYNVFFQSTDIPVPSYYYRFINYTLLYYIHSRIICFAKYVLKQKCHMRKVIK